MSQKRILIIDDDPLVLESIELMLSSEPYQIDLATNGQEALSKFEPGKFDLVLTDNRMSGMSGTELVSMLRSKDATQRIIMFSGMVAADQKPACDLVILKPFSAPDLRKAVAQIIG